MGHKDVAGFVNALPGQPFTEIVVTQNPQTVDVTLARVPPVKIDWLQDFEPGAKVVFHAVSAPANPSELQHRITLPALPAGVYQVRLASAERTAYQVLNVGTIGAMLNVDAKSAVVIATDVRSRRVRRDVAVLVQAGDGVRTFHPGTDGLVRFPLRILAGPAGRKSDGEAGAVVVRASDGSIANVGAPYLSSGSVTFAQTDQQTYRAGDRAFYRYFSREPTTVIVPPVGGLLWTRSHVISASAVIPLWQSRETGWGFFVENATEAPYRIDAGPLTPIVREGDSARIVISVTHWDERPAPHVPVAFAICEGPWAAPVPTGLCGESFGHGVTDASGNLTATITAHRQGFGVSVLQPGFGQVAAYATITVIPKHNGLSIAVPREVHPATCVPVVVSERAPNGAPAADRKVRLESRLLQNFGPGSPSPTTWRPLVTTVAGGYAFARWCATRSTSENYEITAYDVDDQSVAATASVSQVDAKPPLFRSEGEVTFIAPVKPATQAGAVVKMIAASVADGDALVLYGSIDDLHATTASFHDGIARFAIRSPANLDDFSVDIAGPQLSSPQSIPVAVAPKMHLLHVALGFLKRTNVLCAHVSNWRAAGVPARLYVDVTRSTRAGVLDALARSDAPYQALYRAGDFTQTAGTWGGSSAGEPTTSYLYPAPHRRSQQPQAAVQPKAAPTPTPALQPSPTPAPASARILGWFNDVPTDRNGNARLLLASLLPRHGIVLIRVVAVDSDGRIGEGVTSLSR